MTKYKLDQWNDLITEWQKSGITREVFCRKKIESLPPQVKDGFIRYKLPCSPPMGATIEWPEGMKLSLPVHIKFQELAALVRCIRNP